MAISTLVVFRRNKYFNIAFKLGMKKNWIRTLVLVSLLVLQILDVKAQDEFDRPDLRSNNWYVELGGTALFYSVNYEKFLFRTKQEQLIWSARIGFGYNPIEYRFMNALSLDKNTFMVPFSSSILIGPGKDKLELGAGFSMLTKDLSDREIAPSLIAGIRVIEVNRVTFRVNYIPVFRNEQFLHWIGVSLGLNYGKK